MNPEASAGGGADAARPTLENCDREPIHIPGSIQSHGALIAVDKAGTVRHASTNVAAMLGCAIAPGQALRDTPLIARHALLRDLLDEGLATLAGTGELPMPSELEAEGRSFDVVLHQSQELLVLEFEARQESADALAGFAMQAHRAMEKLRRPRPAINDLLQLATQEIKTLTGFDRVMAYRFRQDSSGDVVAESRADFLDAYLGRRYPASDIPAQARALYVANTLRLIADVRATPVPLVPVGGAPLDLSASILRSVSPIHIEYLTNMGVGASMSISIVINNRLWGLLACHHMGPRQVPYSVRMACDVMAQVLGANIQAALARKEAARQQKVTELRMRVMEQVLHSDDEFTALCSHAGVLACSMSADAIIVSEHSKLCTEGGVTDAAAKVLLQWLDATQGGSGIYNTHALPLDAPEIGLQLAPWCGALALPLDRTRGSWLVFLRKEQIETINWGGKPEKEVRAGPLGPRLTPRGSFDLWKEIVRSKSEPWTADELDTARQLLAELVRAQTTRHAELNDARAHLMAVLGHDLRDPLHSISMAARVLEKNNAADGNTGRIGQRIQSSSNRMQRLVSQVMDMSRLQSRLGLNLQLKTVDVVQLLADLVDEARTAHPGTQIEIHLPERLDAQADPDRIAQVVSNLISNARHHGDAGQPIHVHARGAQSGVVIEVRNVAPPIDPAVAANLFTPFKSSSVGNERNRSGLGLGLYIAHQIAQGHGGTIVYTHQPPHVVFTVHLPQTDAAGAAPVSATS
ncbi:ATP-binding protein [Acidovorax sp. LjRoot117]|uniref:ATP-binding protein n=1 Tax=Acidovorax sp. LjRoot117 TaxID=3342255 RepID=UPI003ECD82EB